MGALDKERLMNLYLLTRTDPIAYDEYDSCVVVARNETEALATSVLKDYPGVAIKLIGTTELYDEPTDILASFNAG